MNPVIDCVDRLAPFLRVTLFEVKIEVGGIIFYGVEGRKVLNRITVVVENSDGGIQRLHLFKDGEVGDGYRFIVSGVSRTEGEF